MNKTSIASFDYELPDEKIAKYPIEPRHNSKLLTYKEGEIESHHYLELPDLIPNNTTLILNNTKVIEARLIFQKPTGGIIEVFCLEHGSQYPDVTTAMGQTGDVNWFCQIGGAKKWKEGSISLNFDNKGQKETLLATKSEQLDGQFLIHFEWSDKSMSFAEILHYAGNVPLPPYLNRKAEDKDKSTYQTVYAEYDGSVAAPTAGLHFTNELFDKLKQKNILPSYVTLHVGAGTFKPVKTEHVEDHSMHAEFIDVTLSFIENFASSKGPRISVGTTSLRTLESLYWMGVKIQMNENLNPNDISLGQWEAYHLPQNVDVKKAFDSLSTWMKAHKMERLITRTQIMIKPGYVIRTVDGILTNFHQPKSTLLLLIHAFVGDNWKRIYDYALTNDYRFLSYGDGSLLWKNK